jgi:hypothetical protein
MDPFRRMAAALAAALLSTTPAMAYNVFPYGVDQALKWGDNTVGTPGGVVTWSLMADGTGLDGSAPAGISGTSALGSIFTLIDTAYGSGTAMTALQHAFSSWSAVANISFVQVTETGAVPFSAAYAAVGSNVVGDIRIGAFDIAGFSGAVGYAAPPNGGTTLEGDILFNLNVAYQVAPGTEGTLNPVWLSPSPTNSPAQDGWYHNDLEGLFAHELGHALGLAHSDVPSSLMCGYVSGAFDGSACAYNPTGPDYTIPLNRLPDADDIAGIQHLYGAAAVPEPGPLAMMVAGLGVLGWLRRRTGTGTGR